MVPMGRDPARGGVTPTGADLVEREHELARIDAALEAATAGEGRMLIVDGHAGIGKSGLLAAARERAGRAGVTVLSGLGSYPEGEHSFGLAMQLFEPALADLDSEGRKDR